MHGKWNLNFHKDIPSNQTPAIMTTLQQRLLSGYALRQFMARSQRIAESSNPSIVQEHSGFPLDKAGLQEAFSFLQSIWLADQGVCLRWPSSDTSPVDQSNVYAGPLTCPSTRIPYATYAPTLSQLSPRISQALQAQSEWWKMTLLERAGRIRALASIIAKHQATFCHLEHLSTGKPYPETKADINASIEVLQYFGSPHTGMLGGQSYDNVDGPTTCWTRREPFGCVGLISSFNYPLLLICWKLGPALLCGNAAICKPAPQTPLTVLYLCYLLHQYATASPDPLMAPHLPPQSLIQCVIGGAEMGTQLIDHPSITKVSFTGSTATGKRIASSCGAQLKRVTLELGGKAAVLIGPDVIFTPSLIQFIWDGMFANAGQNCCQASRIYVHAAQVEEFCALIRAKWEESHDDVGPLIDEVQLKRCMEYLKLAIQQQISILCGESMPKEESSQEGYCMMPTILYNVPEESTLAQAEIFGPLSCIMEPWTEEGEVLRRINSSTYGLAAAVFSNNVNFIHRISRALQTGMVWVNTYNTNPPYLPLGGYKQSGIGKDLGLEALHEFSQLKSIQMGTVE